MRRSTQSTEHLKYDKSPPDIKIRGKQSKHVTNKEVRYAINYYLSKLIAPQLKANLKIVVKLKTNDKMNGLLGLAEDVDTSRNPRSFVLEMNSDLERYRFLETLAHECVHIKQMAKRELDTTLRKGHYMKWQGSLVFVGSDFNFEEYQYLPWEVEANGLAIALCHSYAEHLSKYNAIRNLSD